MSELMKFFGQVNGAQQFDSLQIDIAAPSKIRSWSYGEIKKPETINQNAMACFVPAFLVQ